MRDGTSHDKGGALARNGCAYVCRKPWRDGFGFGIGQVRKPPERRKQAKDKRIVYHKLEKNEGISGNTNQCYKLATGDYIGLFDHDDILHPSVLFEYARVIEEKGADYVYCDEATFTGDSINNMITLHFKPDYAVDTLRANNYI